MYTTGQNCKYHSAIKMARQLIEVSNNQFLRIKSYVVSSIHCYDAFEISVAPIIGLFIGNTLYWLAFKVSDIDRF